MNYKLLKIPKQRQADLLRVAYFACLKKPKDSFHWQWKTQVVLQIIVTISASTSRVLVGVINAFGSKTSKQLLL